MPRVQRGEPYKLGKGRWGLRFYGRDGKRRRTKEKFPSMSAALAHYRDVIEPQLNGKAPQVDFTLAEFVPIFLERHASTNVRPRTIETLRKRLGYAVDAFGKVPLRELETMSGELASWRGRLPEGSRYGIVQALRQALGAAVAWRYMASNPAKAAGRNPQPAPRPIRVYTLVELEAITAELPARYRPLPAFASASGLRPEEWAALERRDIDRRTALLRVRQTLSSGELVQLGKTDASRREVPLSDRALAALDDLPPRLDSPFLFAAVRGGPCDLHNFRNRTWRPAIKASGVAEPARPYDMRSTFASNSLAAGVSAFELARLMGTSVYMIERHYGRLLDGAGAGLARRLSAFEAEQERARDQARDEGG